MSGVQLVLVRIANRWIMNFSSDEYFRAATERMRQARDIYHDKLGYALAMYCAGLAVECLLRAFRWRKDRSFEGRHDLEDLLKASELLQTSEDQMREQL
jgi:HEPN domain-containing protein